LPALLTTLATLLTALFGLLCLLAGIFLLATLLAALLPALVLLAALLLIGVLLTHLTLLGCASQSLTDKPRGDVSSVMSRLIFSTMRLSTPVMRPGLGCGS
jgi:hypothetical protein